MEIKVKISRAGANTAIQRVNGFMAAHAVDPGLAARTIALINGLASGGAKLKGARGANNMGEIEDIIRDTVEASFYEIETMEIHGNTYVVKLQIEKSEYNENEEEMVWTVTDNGHRIQWKLDTPDGESIRSGVVGSVQDLAGVELG